MMFSGTLEVPVLSVSRDMGDVGGLHTIAGASKFALEGSQHASFSPAYSGIKAMTAVSGWIKGQETSEQMRKWHCV